MAFPNLRHKVELSGTKQSDSNVSMVFSEMSHSDDYSYITNSDQKVEIRFRNIGTFRNSDNTDGVTELHKYLIR